MVQKVHDVCMGRMRLVVARVEVMMCRNKLTVTKEVDRIVGVPQLAVAERSETMI